MVDFNRTWQLTGAKEFEQMLKALPPAVSSRVGQDAVRAGARVIAKRMRENIRGRGLILSGRMLASVKVTDGDKVVGARVAYAGSASFYARFSEFGTSHQSPAAWARPAVDEAAGAAIDAMGIRMGQAIEAAAARYATAPGSRVTALRRAPS